MLPIAKTHAVPQNIMEVEFKLFGSLTAKQFGYLAGSLFIAFIIYKAFSFYRILGIPLAIAIAGLGLLLAFFQVNGRSFEVFLFNYVSAVFTTQRKLWKRQGRTISLLQNDGDALVSSPLSSRSRSAAMGLDLKVVEQVLPEDNIEEAMLSQIDQLLLYESNSKPSINVKLNDQSFKRLVDSKIIKGMLLKIAATDILK